MSSMYVYLFPFFLAFPNKKLSTWQQTHVLGLSLYLSASMTTLLTHIIAHSTKPSFRPKTNNQPLNPKRPGLFGLLDTRGGAAAAHFRERRLELPNFHFCPQTVFHMKAGIFS